MLPITFDTFDREVRSELRSEGVETLDPSYDRVISAYYYARFTIRETVSAVRRSIAAETKRKENDR